MDDTQIIDLYWDRDQGAITATAGKYGSFLHALSWNILRSHHDAEECVNDTYFRAWNAIPPERPSALPGLAGADHPEPVAGPLEGGAGPKAGARGMETLLGELDECIPDHRGPEQAAEERVLAEMRQRVSAGTERRITGISSCGGTGTARISPPSQRTGLRREPGEIRPVPHPEGPAGIFGKGGDHGMKAERLFRAIGLVDDESDRGGRREPRRGKRPVWRRYGGRGGLLDGALRGGSSPIWLPAAFAAMGSQRGRQRDQ